MAGRTLRVLCIHGVGHQEKDTGWQIRWQPEIRPEFRFTEYDALFDAAELDAATVAEAILRLSASGIVHGIGDLFRRRRAFGGLAERVRWTAGMVAQWAARGDQVWPGEGSSAHQLPFSVESGYLGAGPTSCGAFDQARAVAGLWPLRGLLCAGWCPVAQVRGRSLRLSVLPAATPSCLAGLERRVARGRAVARPRPWASIPAQPPALHRRWRPCAPDGVRRETAAYAVPGFDLSLLCLGGWM